jgi:hypothetical protein
MKPGDLIRLVADPDMSDGVVHVAWIPPTGQRAFDEGTVGVFLGDYNFVSPRTDGERKVRILIEGRLGWIYESECEAIDEAR